MIIKGNSPLRRVPGDIGHRHKLFLDGIRYSIDMADLAYNRLGDVLQQFSLAGIRGETMPNAAFTAAFLDAWAIVDSVHRLRFLLYHMPLLKDVKRRSEYRKFVDATSMVEELRHKVQHLDETIQKIASGSQPVWGSIAWLAALQLSDRPVYLTNSIVAGTIIEGEPPLVNPVGKTIRPINLITLTAYGESVSLSSILESIKSLTSLIESCLSDEFGELPAAGSDLYISIEFVPGVEPKSNQEILVTEGDVLSVKVEKTKQDKQKDQAG